MTSAPPKPIEPEKPKPKLWLPLPGPQSLALASDADIIGFGGQAGGGKSDLLLGAAVTEHRRSIIFRREAKQGRSLIDRSRELLTGHGRFNSVDMIWRDLPDGRQLEFAGVKDPNDVYNWRGNPHDFIGIDEADSFQEGQVRFLLGWLRTTIPGQRCRAVFCFNPPATADGRWLLNFFGPWIDRKHPKPAIPGDLRWYATLKGGKEIELPNGDAFEDSGETIKPKSRTFIPARVQDNPYLMATDYISQLQGLMEPLRSQLLYGDFSAGLQDSEFQCIPTEWVELAMARWVVDGQPCPWMTTIGADCAYGGSDQAVISRRYGNWFDRLLKYPGKEASDGRKMADYVIKALDFQRRPAQKDTLINIDATGWGSAATEHLQDFGLNVNGVNFGEGTNEMDASGRLGFLKMRSLIWWRMREALDPSYGSKIALPPDSQLLADLTAPTWKIRGAGKIQLETKDDLKKRIGRSPDCGDAVCLANFEPNLTAAPGFLTEDLHNTRGFTRGY